MPQLFSPKSCGAVWLIWRILLSQGVCHAFSKAYDFICVRENVLQVAVTALDWLYPRTPSIHAVTTYLVAPGKDEVCRERVCNHQGLKGCFREEVPSPAACVFPVVLSLKLKPAQDSCACSCNKRSAKVGREDCPCKGDPLYILFILPCRRIQEHC